MGYRYNVFTGELDIVYDAATPTYANQFVTDGGTAVPAANILNVLGTTAQGISSSGAGNTVTYTMADATETQKGVSELATDAEAIAGVDTGRTIVPTSLKAKLGDQTANSMPYGTGTGTAIGWGAAMASGNLMIGSTGAFPAPAFITSAGGTIAITNGPNSIDLDVHTSVATSFVTDAGTATPAANILNVLGGLGVNTVGAGATITVNADTGFAPISKYIVDPDGSADYTTIQAGLDAANAAGEPAAVYVRPNSAPYIEDLTNYDGIDLWGAVGVADTETCKIIGTHTPPLTGTLTIRNIFLESATDIFTSAVAGTAALILIDCAVDVTNGYTFNLPNWTGTLAAFDIGEVGSTNDGWINNTGGATVFMTNITMGAGAVNTMIVSGTTELYNVHCQCPISFQGTGTAAANGGCWFDNTVTTAATATVSMANSLIASGANQAISHGSANELSLSDITVDSSNATAIGGTGTILFGSVTYLDSATIAGTITQTLTPILKTGEIHAENIQNMEFSGRFEWGGAGAYYSLAATNFTLLRAGTGYIKGKLVSWLGSQSTGALSTGNTHYIYIDNTGTIGTTTTRNLALFQDNIILFEALVDPNSVVSVVREDHPYDFPSSVSEWAHDTVGTVIANKNQGANIALNGTKGIQIDGAEELEDHGLETDIPDSGAAAVNFTFMFTDGAGKWEIDSTANTFASEYNNAGVVAALGANKYGIFRLYVSKDDLNTATPVYYAVLDDAQYNNLVQAQTAVAQNTPARQSNELAAIELAQLGLVIKEESSDNIVDVIIEKDVGGGSTSLVSPGVASLVATDTTNFNAWLGAADTTVQASLETLDDVGLGVTPQHSVLLGDASYGITSTGVLTNGQLVIGSTGVAPAVATLTPGDGVAITNGAGSITIATEGGGLAWVESTGAAQAMSINTAYGANRGGGVTFTLPATAVQGSVMEIVGMQGLWILAQGAGQTVHYVGQSSTPGAGGFWTATNARDCVTLRCTTTDTDWTVTSGVGNIDPT